jgi:hypothetical protein
MPPRSMSNRIARRVLEFLVGLCLLALAFAFVMPGMASVAYLAGAMVVLFLLLRFLWKWPSI